MIDGRSYRIFICFAHENVEQLQGVISHLRSLGHTPRWSGILQAGTPFPNQIKEEIARAHLFVPILTEASSARPWVNQEIGFALASNVPVLPLALENLPAGLAHELQAVRVQPDVSDLKDTLTCERIEAAVAITSRRGAATYELAPLVEDRTRLIYSAAEWLIGIGEGVRVRQWGTFTSFSLPDADYRDSRWPCCDDCREECNRGLRRDWRRERQSLERHARSAGCDLLIDPHVIDGRKEKMRRVRTRVLRDFLEGMEDDKVRAVVLPPSEAGESGRRRGNQTMLGDWFVADSVTPLPGLGYEQTLATWHAPTVLARVTEFDRIFEKYLADARVPGRSSREVAIEKLTLLYPDEPTAPPNAVEGPPAPDALPLTPA